MTQAFIPLPYNNPINEYIATAGQKTFPFTWLLTNQNYIGVYINGVKKVITTDYTVTGVSQYTGGSVVFTNTVTINANDKIVLKRESEIKSEFNFSELGGVSANVLNSSFTQILTILQELSRDMKTTSSTGTSATVADALLKNSNLSDLENKGTARSNLNVYAKNEAFGIQVPFTEIKDIPAETTEVRAAKAQARETARTNLDIYSKTEVDDRPNQDAFKKKIRNATFQIGDLKMSAKTADHDGWLLADGRAVSRTTYAELFAACGGEGGIGPTRLLGPGDGSTTFNIPNYSGFTLGGAGQTPIIAGEPNFTSLGTMRYLGQPVGAESYIMKDFNLPKHRHRLAKQGAVDGDLTRLGDNVAYPNVVSAKRTGGAGDDKYSLSGYLLTLPDGSLDTSKEPDLGLTGMNIQDSKGVEKGDPIAMNLMQPTKFSWIFIRAQTES